MNRCVYSMAAVAALGVAAESASAISFFDGIFNNSDWTLTAVNNPSGAGSTTVGFQQLTGGNPNEFRRIRNQLIVGAAGNGAITGLHMNVLAFYNPAGGAISTINYSEDSINFVNQGGNGQGSGLVILQSGNFYVQRNPVLVMPYATYSTWQTNAAPGLVATDFWRIDAANNLFSGSNPDFTIAGGTMQFGFWRGNSANQSINTECGIDNWHVDINTVPTPGAAAVFGLGAVTMIRRRRRD